MKTTHTELPKGEITVERYGPDGVEVLTGFIGSVGRVWAWSQMAGAFVIGLGVGWLL